MQLNNTLSIPLRMNFFFTIITELSLLKKARYKWEEGLSYKGNIQSKSYGRKRYDSVVTMDDM